MRGTGSGNKTWRGEKRREREERGDQGDWEVGTIVTQSHVETRGSLVA